MKGSLKSSALMTDCLQNSSAHCEGPTCFEEIVFRLGRFGS